MGLPAGWVTDMPLTRTAQMRLLGNGVVPLQATGLLRAVGRQWRDGMTAKPGKGCSGAPESGSAAYGRESGSGAALRSSGRRDAGHGVARLYTPSEAAEVLRVPESWLRKKAAARVIPYTFLGKHLRFSDDDLEQIVQSGSRQPGRTTSRLRARPGNGVQSRAVPGRSSRRPAQQPPTE